jgi:hypothetical protein
MRALLFFALVVLLLALAGWITFSRDPGRSSINFETGEIEADTRGAIESGKDLLDDAEQSLDSSETSTDREPPASEDSSASPALSPTI